MTAAERPITDADELVKVIDAADRAATSAYDRGDILLRWTTHTGSFTSGLVVGGVSVLLLASLGWGHHVPVWMVVALWALSLAVGAVSGVVLAARTSHAVWLTEQLRELTGTMSRMAVQIAHGTGGSDQGVDQGD